MKSYNLLHIYALHVFVWVRGDGAVAEITCLEEMDACVHVAETGHLVLAVLNISMSVGDTFQRVMDSYPEEARPLIRDPLARVLRAVSTQRLLPKNDGGLVAAYEILIPDDETRQAIADGRDLSERSTSLPQGFRTLAQNIEGLLTDGIITEETAKNALLDRPNRLINGSPRSPGNDLLCQIMSFV